MTGLLSSLWSLTYYIIDGGLNKIEPFEIDADQHFQPGHNQATKNRPLHLVKI
jgi:hypothetical protein